MKARVFTLRVDRETGRLDDAEMVEFLEEHDATALSEHLVQLDGEPALVVVVRWRPASREVSGRGGDAGRRTRGPAEDPRAALDPAEQAAYDALRTWRNDRAKRLGKPSYALFNNHQMADLVRQRPTTPKTSGPRTGTTTSASVAPGRCRNAGSAQMGPPFDFTVSVCGMWVTVGGRARRRGLRGRPTTGRMAWTR